MTLKELQAGLPASGTVRYEEVLLRFDDAGVKGAHFTACVKTPGRAGEVAVEITPPFPIKDAANDAEFTAIIGKTATESLKTIETREATIAERDTTIADMTKAAETLAAENAAAVSELNAAHAAEVASLNEVHAAAITELKAEHAATIADMNTAAKTLADENAAVVEALNVKQAETDASLKAAESTALATINGLTAERDALAKQLAECEAKCEAMESHPDVIAKRKEESVAKARAAKQAAVEAIRKADEILAVADVADVDVTVTSEGKA
jgi:colicin import membrane protein